MEWAQSFQGYYDAAVSYLAWLWQTIGEFHVEIEGPVVVVLFALVICAATVAIMGLKRGASLRRKVAYLEAEAQQLTNELSLLYQQNKDLSHSIPTLKEVMKIKGLCKSVVLPPMYEMKSDEKMAYKKKVEGELKREVLSNIKRLKEIKAYRGIRHQRNLPSRGQRTKTNSRTVRGNVRKTASSGKKPAAQKT